MRIFASFYAYLYKCWYIYAWSWWEHLLSGGRHAFDQQTFGVRLRLSSAIGHISLSPSPPLHQTSASTRLACHYDVMTAIIRHKTASAPKITDRTISASDMRKNIDLHAYQALVGMRHLCGTHTMHSAGMRAIFSQLASPGRGQLWALAAMMIAKIPCFFYQ